MRVKANIILISETWWTDKSAVIIPGFNLYRKDRVSSKGGGVCVYIEDKIKSYEIQKLSRIESSAEEIWCMAEIGIEKILIGCIYRKGASMRGTYP